MATYYVSNAGSDSANGTSTSTPFRTLSKLQSVLVAGDTGMLLRGDRWKESLTLPGSNITIGAYGAAAVIDDTGYCTNAPVIDGGGFITGWTPYVSGASDSIMEDNFTGTAGSNVTGSVEEIGSGVWVSQLGFGTMIFSGGAQANMARRNNASTQAFYTFSQLIAGNAHRNTTKVKIASLDATVDTARIHMFVNPSGQGFNRSVWAQIQWTAAGSLKQFKTGYVAGTTTGVTTDTVAFAAGESHDVTVEMEQTATALEVRGYLDGVLINTFDLNVVNPSLAQFWGANSQVGIQLGNSTSAVGSDTTGMQIDSIKVEPLGVGAPAVNTYQATVATDPKVVDLRGELCSPGAGPNLLEDGEYAHSNGVLYVSSDVGAPSDTDVIGGVLSNGIVCNTRSGIVIDGIAFEHQMQSAILWTAGASNNTLRNCMAQRTGGDEAVAGVFSLQGAQINPLVESCVVRHSRLDGIWFDQVSGPTVRDCIIGPFVGGIADGIQVGSPAAGTTVNSLIQRNYIDMVDQTTPKGGIILFGNSHVVEDNYLRGGLNFGLSCPGNNFVVRRNVFYKCGRGGGVRITDSAGVAHDTHLIHHNVFVDCLVSMYLSYADGTTTITAASIYANTIINNEIEPQQVLFPGYGIGQVYSAVPLGGAFKDNLLWNPSGAGRSCTITTLHASGWTSDYNLIGPESTGFINFTGTSYNTLAAYVLGKGQDFHSLTDDPLLLTTGPPTSTTGEEYGIRPDSPARNAGVAVAGVTT